MPENESPPMPSTQSATLAEGLEVFGHYVLRRFLGSGTLGNAWLAVKRDQGRELSVRFVPEAWILEERAMTALHDAVEQARKATHPAVVSILDFVRNENSAAVVTRFVDGKTLEQVRTSVPKQFLKVSVLQAWITELCEALAVAWEDHQIIHGDLCPQNLLVTDADEFRVLDFGLARSLYDVPGTDGKPLLSGTQAYMSPERAKGAPVTVADDVYGFGATVYELLTGKPVFFEGDISQQLETELPPSITDRRTALGIKGDPIPKEWEEVVSACLAKRSEDRPRDLREIGERLGLLAPQTREALPLEPKKEIPAPEIVAAPEAVAAEPEVSAGSQLIGMASDTVCGEVEEDIEPAKESAPPLVPSAPSIPPPSEIGAAPEEHETVAALEPPATAVPPEPPKAIPAIPATTVPASISEPPPIPAPEPVIPPPSPTPTPAVPPPIPAPEPAKAQTPPPPATPQQAPQPSPAAVPAAKGPSSAPVQSRPGWIVPAIVVTVVAVGATALVLSRAKMKEPMVTTPTPTPIPATPVAISTPTPTPATPAAATPATIPGREITVNGLEPLANKGSVAEILFLTGEFRVSSALDRDVILRPTDKALTNRIRVSARFQQASQSPAEGATVRWTRQSGLQIREVRRGNDGQLNVEVVKTGKP